MPELLELDVTDGVGVLRLKRPPLNILNRALVTEWPIIAVDQRTSGSRDPCSPMCTDVQVTARQKRQASWTID